MTLEIKEFPGEPIILFHVGLPHNPQADVGGALQATTDFQKKLGQHVYRVVDLSLFNLTFSEAMMGMAAERGMDGGVNDPNVSTIYIGSNDMVKMGVTAFQTQDQYGKTNVVAVCSTVDEGLAAARAEIEKNKK